MLIVGGGPAGLSVASGLADDVSAILVHRDREIGRPVRTSGGSWLSDMEKLGLPSRLYRVIDRLEVCSANARARFRLESDNVVVLDVEKLYRHLLSLSNGKNRTLHTATRFLSTRVQGDGTCRSEVVSGGVRRCIVSRYLVDASGWQARVLQGLGQVERPARVGVGHEYEFECLGGGDRAVLFVGSRYAESGYGWIFPTREQTVRLGVGVIRPDSRRSPRAELEAFLAAGEAAKLGFALGRRLSVQSGVIPSVRFDPRLVFGRVVRVGDSANQATPVAGEGIRVAIGYGRTLGSCLTRAIHSGSDASLRAYERACASELRRNYGFGFAANLRAARYDDAKWDSSVRRLARLGEKEVIALLRSEFGLAAIARAVAKNIRRKLAGGAGDGA